MGEILVARRTLAQGSEQTVVVKRVLPRLASDPRFRRMFEEEIRIAAAIQHPNTVHVLDVISVDGGLMLVMEHLDGITVGQLITTYRRRRVPIPLAVAVTIVVQLCEALHAMHARGRAVSGTSWIHRDVTPANIILTSDGYTKLIDFGVAKDLGRTGDTFVGEVKGKLGYQAPEQLQTAAIDHRVDIYAAGIVLHEMLTQQRMFPVSLAVTDMIAARRRSPRLSRVFHPEATDAIDAVIARALAFDPADRFDAPRELAAALMAIPGARIVPPSVLAEAVHQARMPEDAADNDTDVQDWTTGVISSDELDLEAFEEHSRATTEAVPDTLHERETGPVMIIDPPTRPIAAPSVAAPPVRRVATTPPTTPIVPEEDRREDDLSEHRGRSLLVAALVLVVVAVALFVCPAR